MVTVVGRMVVNTIRGKYGNFNVANLFSQLGDYVVRYEGLDEYEAGTYQGEFILKKTELRTRDFGVGKIIEPIAYLEGVNLYDAAEGVTEEIPEAIPDPLEEEEISKPKAKRKAQPISDRSELNDNDKELKKLFGAWPLSDEIKLDPTVGRSTLRQQTTYLKSVGYKYNPKQQVWIKNH